MKNKIMITGVGVAIVNRVCLFGILEMQTGHTTPEFQGYSDPEWQLIR